MAKHRRKTGQLKSAKCCCAQRDTKSRLVAAQGIEATVSIGTKLSWMERFLTPSQQPSAKDSCRLIQSAFAEALGGQQCARQKAKQNPCRLCDSGDAAREESIEFLPRNSRLGWSARP